MKDSRPPSALRCRVSLELASGIIGQSVRSGKQALAGSHRNLVSGHIDCSVNLEEAVGVEQRSGEKIVDYLLVDRDHCEKNFVEVHPASSTANVSELVDKRNGTTSVLKRMGIRADGCWYWIVGGGGTICFKANDR